MTHEISKKMVLKFHYFSSVLLKPTVRHLTYPFERI